MSRLLLFKAVADFFGSVSRARSCVSRVIVLDEVVLS